MRGAKVYITCAVCHSPEGWGSPDGDYPQIAGQLYTVIIKQLADIRARNRDNPLMYPFSVPRILGGAQEMADVAAYVSRLPMTADNGKGPGTDLELGKRLITSIAPSATARRAKVTHATTSPPLPASTICIRCASSTPSAPGRARTPTRR